MDCRQKEKITAVARCLVIATGFLGLTLVGTALIAISPPGQDKDSDGGIFALLVVVSADAGSMEKNESSGSEKSIFLSIPAVVGVQNLDCKRPGLKIIAHNALQNRDFSRFGHLTTTASISPRKALEFTLLGAKPSGTS